MPSHDISRFVLIIANITGRSSERVSVALTCFLFQIDDKTDKCLPVLLGKFRVVSTEQNKLDRSDVRELS